MESQDRLTKSKNAQCKLSSRKKEKRSDAAFFFCLCKTLNASTSSLLVFPSTHMRYLVKCNPGYDSKNETEKGGNNKAHNIEAGETHLFAQKIPVRTVLDQVLLEAIKKGRHVLKSLVNVCLLLGVGFHPDLHHHHIEDVVAGTVETGIKQRILLKVFAGKAEETA